MLVQPSYRDRRTSALTCATRLAAASAPAPPCCLAPAALTCLPVFPLPPTFLQHPAGYALAPPRDADALEGRRGALPPARHPACGAPARRRGPAGAQPPQPARRRHAVPRGQPAARRGAAAQPGHAVAPQRQRRARHLALLPAEAHAEAVQGHRGCSILRQEQQYSEASPGAGRLPRRQGAAAAVAAAALVAGQSLNHAR